MVRIAAESLLLIRDPGSVTIGRLQAIASRDELQPDHPILSRYTSES
jgi:hypothetical protein